MKKNVLIAVVILAFLAVSAVSFAEEGKGKEKHYKGSMMMKKMMQPKMVATQDGGVVVLVGSKLMKYDKKLNLVKKVKVKSMKEMCKKMMEKKGKCPMCGSKMEGKPTEE